MRGTCPCPKGTAMRKQTGNEGTVIPVVSGVSGTWASGHRLPLSELLEKVLS